MSAVTSVHEHVHEGAGEDEQVGQEPKSVREMLGPQQDTANGQEGRADEKSTRCPERPVRRLRRVRSMSVIV
jgi:hypothetical protein